MTEKEIERFALPLREAERVRQRILEGNAPYLAGWEEGYCAPSEGAAPFSCAIASFEGMERLVFWRGHRDGRITREANATPQQDDGAIVAGPHVLPARCGY